MKDPTDAHRATGRVLEVFESLAAAGETTTLAALAALDTLAARMDVPTPPGWKPAVPERVAA